ncbi:hypothetical protein C7974DRAFT_380835 [Boeremia exigua]|uniref:uncharacterized protein n=1 Tax=Boeremia exigua TaxID=749465 RepID=UPI001E8E022F|nr:uncharacterized protein C7974DRAFT_380835 [Boeremia exigua]KAH6613122.1 hypothetical protein C7974DRAFT_380835 [Boeremia exigua]
MTGRCGRAASGTVQASRLCRKSMESWHSASAASKFLPQNDHTKSRCSCETIKDATAGMSESEHIQDRNVVPEADQLDTSQNTASSEAEHRDCIASKLRAIKSDRLDLGRLRDTFIRPFPILELDQNWVVIQSAGTNEAVQEHRPYELGGSR